ncbi:MAG TPA: hypothetical protein VGG72_26655 [Bryobacteraceae bacterium]|jgi:hypothetical protein
MRFLLRFERRWLDLLFRAAPLVGLGFAAAPLVFVGAGWSAEYCDIREDGLFESLRELKPPGPAIMECLLSQTMAKLL